MDGKAYERDDLGDTQIYYRFGQEPMPGADVSADDGHSPSSTGPLPSRSPAGGWDSGNWADPIPATAPPEPGSTTSPPRAAPTAAPESSAHPDPPFVRRSGPVFKRAQYGEPVVDDTAGTSPYGPPVSHRGGAQAWGDPAATGFTSDATWPAVPADRDEVRRHELSKESPAAAVADPEVARSAAPVGADASASRTSRSRRVMPFWQELPLLLIVAFCLAVLVRTFLLQAFYIPSSSMERTLLVGDRVMVNKIVYDVRQPARGEIVVFAGPSNWTPENPQVTGGGLMTRFGRTLGDLVGVSRPGEKDFIKRVIGVPGDRVSCCDPAGRIYVNGKGIDEPYINVNSSLDAPPNPKSCSSRRFDEVLVPPGQLFVMGDNRIVSQDSRCQGTVPIENVIGRAFMIAWPGSRWDSLSVPETFGSVPDPVALRPSGWTGTGHPAPIGGVAVVLVPLVTTLGSGGLSGRRWRREDVRFLSD